MNEQVALRHGRAKMNGPQRGACNTTAALTMPAFKERTMANSKRILRSASPLLDKRFDLSGKRFGRWEVISLAGSNSGRVRFWNCRCECGTERQVEGSSLAAGRSTSCGCSRIGGKGGRGRPTHGLSNTSIYWIYNGMMARCYNPNVRHYKYYGARGIQVCERWRNSIKDFAEDMGPRPSPRHSIDRIDNDGNYEPSNCRWATRNEQCRNTRASRKITFCGETKSMAQWCEDLGIDYRRTKDRIGKLGWTAERAFANEQ